MVVWNCPPSSYAEFMPDLHTGRRTATARGTRLWYCQWNPCWGQNEDSRVSSGKHFSSRRVLAVQRATNMYHSLQPRHTTPPPRGQQCQGAEQHECLVSHTQNCLLLFTSISVAMPVCSKCLTAPGIEEARLLLFNSLRIPHFVGNLHISIHICVYI